MKIVLLKTFLFIKLCPLLNITDMKATLIYIFNVTRNFCLFLFLVLIGIAIYLEYNRRDTPEPYLSSLSSISLFTEPVHKDDNLVVIQSNSGKRIKIKSKNGYAYIDPSQIIYADNSGMHLIGGALIRSKATLTELMEVLVQTNPEAHTYIRAKSYILNCDYIVEIFKENTLRGISDKYSYQNKVRFVNNNTINISKDIAEELIEKMEYL